MDIFVWPCVVNIASCLCGDIWGCLKEKVGGMCKINENLNLLRNALEDLKEERNDVEARVKAGVHKGERVQAKVTKWLSQVEIIVSNTNQLIADASCQDASSQVVSSNDASGQNASSQGVSSNDASVAHPGLSTSGCCWSRGNFSNCCLSGKVSEKLNEVINLTSRGKELKVVTEKVPPRVVNEIHVDRTFGLNATLDETWTSLMKDENRVLGIHGIGGVGKTTLLKQINNKFCEVQDDFDVVIWVKVSRDDIEKKQVDIKKIQDTIGERLDLCHDNWGNYSREKKTDEINRVLTFEKPRFVMLLDDLWEKVSLTKIGIPLHQEGEKRYKVVFTTRSEDVCKQMGANKKIRVDCLEEEDALELLKMSAGCSELEGTMRKHAQNIVKRCGGLPLAVEVIGKCLFSKTTADAWNDVLDTLDSCPEIVEGMVKEVFHVFKVSYDRLEDNEKSCFRYCALFPKAYNIRQKKLVEYWICEDILTEREERKAATRRGAAIIKTLVEASLLLKDESTQKVYMHEMIREMALWIVSKFGDGERFVVKTDADRSCQLPYVADWTTVTKMSLIEKEIKSIPEDPEIPKPAGLITLFLQNNKLEKIAGNFFQVMSSLVVLDLSGNLNITEFSKEIVKLVALRFLNLSGTSIKNLPDDLSAMTQLIHLNLESTSNLRSISLISKLRKLQVLRFFNSGAPLDLALLKDLEGLKGLQLLTITVRNDEGVLRAFLESNLASKTHGLFLEELQVSRTSFSAIARLGSLQKLEMVKCGITESGIGWKSKRIDQSSPSTSSSSEIIPSNTWFKNLSAVKIMSCIYLKDLTWLIYAENLESLSVESSPKMEEVISKEKAEDVNVEPFRNLQVLCLDYLDALKSIYWIPLAFPKLNKVLITSCPKLHKLPLHSSSVEKIGDLRMEVETEWLKKVEWENGAEHRFLPFIISMASAV